MAAQAQHSQRTFGKLYNLGSGIEKWLAAAGITSLLRRTFILAIPTAPSFALAGARERVLAPTSEDRIQLRVRTANEELDEAVYKGVFEPFSAVMPLKIDPPFSGGLEITFSTTGHDWFTGESHQGDGDMPVAGWYVGGRTAGAAPPVPRSLEWQTSQMRAVLRSANGSRSWSAAYVYNGGLELSGWVVKTPAQAATLIARRLSARFKADIGTNANS